MAAKDNAWRAFKDKMKQKQTKGLRKDTKRLKKSELIVQRLSTEVSGKLKSFVELAHANLCLLIQRKT